MEFREYKLVENNEMVQYIPPEFAFRDLTRYIMCSSFTADESAEGVSYDQTEYLW